MELKQRWKSLFWVPRHAKPAEENIWRLFMPSLVGILVCMVCLAGMTWAWFSAGVRTKPQMISTATFDVNAVIAKDSGETVSPSLDGVYLLEAGTYQVTLTAVGNVINGGYCMLRTEGKTYYTDHLQVEGQIRFSLTVQEKGSYSFIALWGTYSGKAEIHNGVELVLPSGDTNVNVPEKQQEKKMSAATSKPQKVEDSSNSSKTQGTSSHLGSISSKAGNKKTDSSQAVIGSASPSSSDGESAEAEKVPDTVVSSSAAGDVSSQCLSDTVPANREG